MEPTEKELIDHIRNVLISEEFNYREGAWEKFAEQQNIKKPSIPWLRIWSAAAVLFLVVSSILYKSFTTQSVIEHGSKTVKNKPVHQNETAKVLHSDKAAGAKYTPKAVSEIKQVSVHGSGIEHASGSKYYVAEKGNSGQQKTEIKDKFPVQSKESLAAVVMPDQASQLKQETFKSEEAVKNQEAVKNHEIPKNQVPAQKLASAANQVSTVKKRTLADLPPEPLAKTTAKEGGWKFGLTMAQGAGTETKISSGYGVAVGYQFSPKISLNSGVGYTYTKAEKNIDAIGISNAGNGPASKQTDFGGIDLPLEISYALNKKFYVSAGVSANVILNQKDIVSYVENAVQSSPYNISETGLIAFRESSVVTKTEVPVPKDEINGRRYIGYYNFSFGYQQKLSEGNALTIEPFLKIPTQEFSNDKLKLNIIGVRLRYNIH